MTVQTTHIANYDQLDEAITHGNVKVLQDSLGATPLSGEEDLRRLMSGRPSVGSSHARGTGRSPVIQFSVSEEDAQRLDEYASNHGMRRAQAARHAVHLMLANA